MTWDDYAAQRAKELATCRDEDSFEEILGRIVRDLKIWKTESVTKEDFWKKLRVAYEAEPKPMIKEATAGAKLNALLTRAEALLAQARERAK